MDDAVSEKPEASKVDVEALMLREYDYHAEAFQRSEEFGEKRVASFLAVVTAVGAVLGFLLEGKGFEGVKDSERFGYCAVAVTAFVALIFGQLTLGRVIKRNIASDECKQGLARARAWFVDQDRSAEQYLRYPSREPPKLRLISVVKLDNGGWAETMIVTNALLGATFAGATFAAVCSSSQLTWVAVPAGGLVAMVLVYVNVERAKKRYADAYADSKQAWDRKGVETRE